MEAKYPLAIRITHWLMAILVIVMLAVGLRMVNIPRGDPMHDTIYALHKSVGVIVLLLCLLRIGLRVRLGTPALPDVIPVLEKKLAHLGHMTLYAFMLAMPLSGYLMTNSFGFAVKFFGIELPKLVGTDRDMGHFFGEFHEIAGYMLIVVILGHIGAVAKHYKIDRVNLLRRMV